MSSSSSNESSTKSLLQDVETTVSDKMRNIENMMLPELDRIMDVAQHERDKKVARLETAKATLATLQKRLDATVAEKEQLERRLLPCARSPC